jgi:hypothetical protein
MVGAKVSITVTIAVQLLELPTVSVAVKVMDWVPMALQSNTVKEAENTVPEQLSVEPPSKSLAEMVACPRPSK